MEDKRTYTVEEAGAMIGLCRNSAYTAAQNGEIPTVRIGRRLLVPRAEFDRLFPPVPEQANPAA